MFVCCASLANDFCGECSKLAPISSNLPSIKTEDFHGNFLFNTESIVLNLSMIFCIILLEGDLALGNISIH